MAAMVGNPKGYAVCCRRRRLQAKLWVSCWKDVLWSATKAVGAAGGGWTLLTALRAATEVAGTSTRSTTQCAGTTPEAHDDEAPKPQHIAVIMDGNRRYGRREHGDSLSGHRAGGERLRDFVEWCVDLGIGTITVFAFSTENWKRPPDEVQAMMDLFMQEVPRLGEHTYRLNVSVRFLSSDEGLLPPELKVAMRSLEEHTSGCTGMRLNVCVSYGGRGDVSHACQQLAREVAAGEVDPSSIDERAIAKRLTTSDVPDPDVLIRTSGERRLSNFLMFQLAYTELFFLDKHWPDVTREDLLSVVRGYQSRNRRYGR